MSTTPSDRLRKARQDRGFTTAADAARAFGWSEVTYTSHENGTRGIRKDAAQRYAKAFGVSAGYILGLQTTSDRITISDGIPIIRDAALGIWRDKMYSETTSGGHVSAPSGQTVSSDYGVRIADASVDKKFPKGAIAICRPVSPDEAAALPDGAFVVVEQDRGGLIETTVRRLHVLGEKFRLSTHSTDPRLTDNITVKRQDVSDVVIAAKVVGIYIPV